MAGMDHAVSTGAGSPRCFCSWRLQDNGLTRSQWGQPSLLPAASLFSVKPGGGFQKHREYKLEE